MNKLINNLICRSCLLKKEQLVNAFTEYDPVNELKYAHAYYICTNVVINKTDTLPKMLCEDCIYELQIAYQFQQRAKESNDALLKLVNNSIKNMKKDVLIHNAATGVNAEHGYSFLSISPIPASPERSQQCSNDDINLNIIENEFIISLDGPNEDNEEDIKYSVVEINQNEEFSFNCARCGDGFDTNELLEEHLTEKHTLVMETLKLEINSDEHNLEETEPNFVEHFFCNICEATFEDQSSLDDHYSFNHQDEQQEDERHIIECDISGSVNKRYSNSKYLCSVCGKNFTTNQRLRIHTYTHTGERNYDCDLCSKKFATEFRLRSHRRTHTGERPYECSVCKLRFAQANALKCHKRVHTGEKPYECPYCSKKFSQNTILKTHMTLHTGKTIQCPDCDKKFSRASYLILHRREHTGEKPYACDRCPNRYKQKSHLDRHMDIHNGVKYKCSVCSKEYSKQYSLKMHMFTHSNEKPFNCPRCAATFTRSDRYKNHLKLRHADVKNL